MRCQHCYISEGPTGKPGKQELTTAEVKRILDEITAAGTLWLLLTGGEPVLWPHLRELVALAHEEGVRERVLAGIANAPTRSGWLHSSHGNLRGRIRAVCGTDAADGPGTSHARLVHQGP